MDAELLTQVLDVLTDSAIADGLDPDLGKIAFEFDGKGGVKITSTSAAGVDYSTDATAEDIAAALGMEPVEEPEAAVPEKAAA